MIKNTVLNVATERLGVLVVPAALVHEAANGAGVPVGGTPWFSRPAATQPGFTEAF